MRYKVELVSVPAKDSGVSKVKLSFSLLTPILFSAIVRDGVFSSDPDFGRTYLKASNPRRNM